MRTMLLTFVLVAAPLWMNAQRVLPVGSGVLGSVYDLTTFEDQLVLGGQFASFDGHTRRNLQGWDGQTHFDLPGSFEASTDRVRKLEHFNGNLIAAGIEPNFNNIASWDGSTWSSLGVGTSWEIRDLVVFENELIACGENGSISRWNGSDWTPLLTNGSGWVYALAVFNDTLYAGANFPPYFLRLDGSNWSGVDEGVNNTVFDLFSSGGSLFIGGSFTAHADGNGALPYLATYDGFILGNSTGFTPTGSVFSITSGPGNDGIIVATSAFSTHLTQGRPIPWLPRINALAILNDRIFVVGPTNMSRLYPIGSFGIGELFDGADVGTLDVGGIGPTSTPTSTFFHNAFGSNGPGFEAPIGSGRHSLFFALPWIAGWSNDTLFTSCSDLAALPQEARWVPGPVSNGSDVDLRNRYGQVWRVNRGVVEHHLAHFNDPGYSPPFEIAGWPGNGSVVDSEPDVLAPFNDLNDNDVYEPELGEHPETRGDQSDYFVLNDAHPIGWGGENSLGVDMHVMHYTYWSSWLPQLYNSLFTNIKIINRSNRTYGDLRFGMFCDWDIGGYTDDMVACDTTLDLTFAYNVFPNDPDGFNTPGYGAYPPSAGCVFLNQTLSSHRAFGNFMGGSNSPSTPLHYWRLLNGLYTNGDPLVDPNGDTTSFQFHGDPNVPGSWFYQPTPTTPDYDVQDLSAIGPFTLAPGDTLCVDLAFVFAQDSAGGNLGSVALLKERVAQVRAWYQQQNVQCNGSYGLVTGAPDAIPSTLALHIFPNPANDRITIRLGALNGSATVRMLDAQGRLVRNERVVFNGGNAEVDLTGTTSGLYTVQVESKTAHHHARLLVAH